MLFAWKGIGEASIDSLTFTVLRLQKDILRKDEFDQSEACIFENLSSFKVNIKSPAKILACDWLILSYFAKSESLSEIRISRKH